MERQGFRGSFGWMAILGAIGLLGLAGPAGAVPAPPFPIALEKDDGSTIRARMYGDEHLSWLVDLDGWALARDPASGAWHYAELGPDGRLRATPYRHGSVEPASVGLKRHLQPSPALLEETRTLRDGLLRAPQPPRVSGEVCNLVLLVRFANQSSQFDAADFEPVFNGASGSVWEYYDEVSYGQVDMQSTIVGWIDLPYDDSYYAYNEYTHGYPQRMVRHAADALDDQGFDFSQFDCNNDGEIDAIDVIHSGPGYETSGDSDHIHSHYSSLSWTGDTFYKDGVEINAYHTEPEVQANGVDPTQIGVIVHETGHFFGLPDLYDYGYDSGGIGLWGVMCSGPWAGPNMDGTVPTHFSIWSKYKLGWVSPQHIQANAYGVRLRPADSHADGVRLDAGLPYRQYFLLENRQQQSYDSYLPGAGLLIFHIDDNQSSNDDQNHYLVDLEQADGLRELNSSFYEQGDSADPWPYGGKDAFTPSSNPSSDAYGGSDSDVSVLAITRSGSDVTFDVDIDGAAGAYLSLSPGSLSFSGAAGGSPPPAQAMHIEHQGDGPLSWTATAQQGWVSISPGSGATPDSASITVDPAALGPGNHQGSIRISSPAAGNSPQTLSVNLYLSDAPPALSLSSTAMDFSGVAGGAPPRSHALTVSNAGGGQLSWTASSDRGWLGLSQSQGDAPSTVQVQLDTSGMSSGSYQGSLHFEAGEAGEAWLDVSLILQRPAHLAVDPTALRFSATVGGPAPAGRSLVLSNSGGSAMAWTAQCNRAWLSCTPAAGDGGGQLWVEADPSGMPVGQQSGALEIRSPAADNSPLSVPITLEVLPDNSPPGTPVPISPEHAADIETPNPELTLQNADDPDGDALTYQFEVIPVGAEEPYWTVDGVIEGIGFTSVEVVKTLNPAATYRWRARALDERGLAGDWSELQLFTVVDSSGGGSGCASGGPPAGGAWLLLLGLAWLSRRRGR